MNAPGDARQSEASGPSGRQARDLQARAGEPLIREPVAAWMSTRLATIGPDATALEALERMAEREVRRLPVLDSAGALIGIITREDALSALRRAGPEVEAPPAVRHAMTSRVHTVGSDATLAHVAQIMLRRQVGGVPVLQAGRPVGILTESDLFRFIVGKLNEAAPAG